MFRFRMLFFLLLCLPFFTLQAQQLKQKDRQAILTAMAEQETAWNNGDLEAFMESYWRSDSLIFVGKRGMTRGWQATLNNYYKGYPDRQAMGILNFKILKLEKAGKGLGFMVGKWHLERKDLEDLSGHFSLLWKKIDGRWKIIADHSS